MLQMKKYITSSRAVIYTPILPLWGMTIRIVRKTSKNIPKGIPSKQEARKILVSSFRVKKLSTGFI
jgi:hypothetical protein